MSCYSPYLARVDPFRVTKSGHRKIIFLGQTDPTDKETTVQALKDGELILIPCGKCIGCRLDHARHWADRMILELDHMKKAVFVTLTYNNEYLPPSSTNELGEPVYLPNDAGFPITPLVKFHMPMFMKRLREDLNREDHLIKFFEEWRGLCNRRREKDPWKGFPSVQVRFYGCGEYGEKRGRCHMHIILFGLSLADLQYLQGKQLEALKRNEFGHITYRSEYLTSLWQMGNVDVSEASYQTMGYVARYTQKKVNGNPYADKYGLPPEFVLMSRNPGIGGYFIQDHPGRIDEVSTWYHSGGKELHWPRYLIQKAHQSFCDVEVFDPLDEYGYKHYTLPVLDGKGREIKARNQSLVVDKFINDFVNDSRPYYEKQLFLERQKHVSAKKLVRGDVTLD